MNDTPSNNQKRQSHSHSGLNRTYKEQQVMLFWLLAKILRRLARSIMWSELSVRDKRRLYTTLETLESDVHLIQIVISAKHTAKAASPKEIPSEDDGLPRPPAPTNGTDGL